jgi:hypothetical protein
VEESLSKCGISCEGTYPVNVQLTWKCIGLIHFLVHHRKWSQQQGHLRTSMMHWKAPGAFHDRWLQRMFLLENLYSTGRNFKRCYFCRLKFCGKTLRMCPGIIERPTSLYWVWMLHVKRFGRFIMLKCFTQSSVALILTNVFIIM